MGKVFVGTSRITLESTEAAYKMRFVKEQKYNKMLFLILGVAFNIYVLVINIKDGYIFNTTSRFDVFEIFMRMIGIFLNLGVGVFIIMLPNIMDRGRIKRQYKDYQKAGLLSLVTTITINDEGLTTENEQDRTMFKWEQISKVYLYKGYLIFWVADITTTLKLTDLFYGSAEDVINYVNEKTPLVKYLVV